MPKKSSTATNALGTILPSFFFTFVAALGATNNTTLSSQNSTATATTEPNHGSVFTTTVLPALIGATFGAIFLSVILSQSRTGRNILAAFCTALLILLAIPLSPIILTCYIAERISLRNHERALARQNEWLQQPPAQLDGQQPHHPVVDQRENNEIEGQQAANQVVDPEQIAIPDQVVIQVNNVPVEDPQIEVREDRLHLTDERLAELQAQNNVPLAAIIQNANHVEANDNLNVSGLREGRRTPEEIASPVLPPVNRVRETTNHRALERAFERPNNDAPINQHRSMGNLGNNRNSIFSSNNQNNNSDDLEIKKPGFGI